MLGNRNSVIIIDGEGIVEVKIEIMVVGFCEEEKNLNSHFRAQKLNKLVKWINEKLKIRLN